MQQRVFIGSLVSAFDAAQPAQAHEALGGFSGGFLHLFTGYQHHGAALIAVGLWSAFSESACLVLPVVFPFLMVIGGLIAVVGGPLPGVEIGIAAWALIFGGMLACAVRLPMRISAALVGAFSFCFGYAHGNEIWDAGGALAFSFGYLVSTVFLLLTGVAIGLTTQRWRGTIVVRAAGSAIIFAGAVLLGGAI